MKKRKYIIFACMMLFLPFMVVNAASECISCGDGLVQNFPAGIAAFTRNLINDLKLLVPIALIGYGMYDFVKAIISGDEKVGKESQSAFIRRCIAAIMIFFVVAIVQLIFGLIPGNTKFAGCIPCFVSDEGSCDGPYACETHRGNKAPNSNLTDSQNGGKKPSNSSSASSNSNTASTSGSCGNIKGEKECWNAGCRWENNKCGSSTNASSNTAPTSSSCSNIKAERECWNANCRWSNNKCISK